jgi:hypothetical protein
MDVGEPEREIIVEPIEDPVRREEPAEPVEPTKIPEQTPA